MTANTEKEIKRRQRRTEESYGFGYAKSYEAIRSGLSEDIKTNFRFAHEANQALLAFNGLPSWLATSAPPCRLLKYFCSLDGFKFTFQKTASQCMHWGFCRSLVVTMQVTPSCTYQHSISFSLTK